MENTLLIERRSDMFHVDPRAINVIDGFNVREDYGDITALAESIKENGVRVNLRGYKKNGEYYLTDGHRRLKACMLLIEQGIEIRVPFVSEKAPSEERRLVDMFVCNDGKRLTPLEESTLINRLRNCGLTVKEISTNLGVTETHIYNMLILSDVPTKLKNRIRENEISATLVMDVIKSNKSLDEAVLLEKVETALDNAKKTGKKVTKKTMDEEFGNINSMVELRKAMKLIPDNSTNELYKFCKSLLENKLSCDDILAMLTSSEVVSEIE